MKDLAKTFSSMVFILGLVFLFNGCNQSKDSKTEMKASNAGFPGLWIVTDSTGNKFDITLNKDGTATSTWSVLNNGKWEVVENKKAHIKWHNGANEFIIIDERGSATRQAFAPGKSTEGKPNEITQIKKK